MATPSLSYQNKFATTLSSGVTATDTTIPLTNLPTPSEGYLILEPDSSTAWEEIYYTSKTGSAVVVPSVAAGRGVGGSTAASHSSGATVRMDSSAELFTTLQDTTALTGLHTQNTERGFDHVASGCVWSGDAYASTKAASMTSGVAYINGRRHTVAAVTARTFTASKDTYIDLLYSLVDNIATPVYTEVTNNAASPALAANSIRIGIIVTGATTIAAAGSVNQGQEDRVLPIASSIPYAFTDSLGNIICPRDPQRRILGQRQVTTQFSVNSVTLIDVTGLSLFVNVPAGRKIIAYFGCRWLTNTTSANGVEVEILDVTSSVVVGYTAATIPTANYVYPGGITTAAVTPTASGFRNYKVMALAGSSTGLLTVTTGQPLYLRIELV